jgi:phosphonate transport system substrate-binding protein
MPFALMETFMSGADQATSLAARVMPGRRAVLAVLAAGAAGKALSVRALAAEPVRIGMIPDAGATHVSIEQKAPLQDYLGKALGRPVQLVIPTNYNATVEALGNGSLDFAYLGGLTYVKAHASYGVVPLVQRKIDTEFHSLFITQATSGIHTLADLKGKTFAFGDIVSTSGHLMPYLAMTQAGVDPDSDLKSFRYTGSHAATVEAVAAGIVDAGACDETVFHGLIDSNKVNGAKLRVFYTTPSFTDYVWAAAKSVPADLQARFAEAFLQLTPAKDAAVLGILRGTEFVRASDGEYAAITEVATKLHML